MTIVASSCRRESGVHAVQHMNAATYAPHAAKVIICCDVCQGLTLHSQHMCLYAVCTTWRSVSKHCATVFCSTSDAHHKLLLLVRIAVQCRAIATPSKSVHTLQSTAQVHRKVCAVFLEVANHRIKLHNATVSTAIIK
jgi:hypothetical protein